MTVAVQTDAEGYLANKDDWSEELANELAQELGVALSDVKFNPVNGFEYVKPRHLIANDNTAASFSKALENIKKIGG